MSGLRDQLQSSLGSSYTIERELGGGGMSRVFLANELRFGRRVVVKILSPELAEQISSERFEREIRVAARLQQANIVPVLSAGESNGLPFYTMPYVEGESLRARLERGPLALSDALSILRDVARALIFAHEHGIVHRDIKPENVLLSGRTAVVTDFGIAKAITESITTAGSDALTQAGRFLGTPAYMAPEQAVGDPVDHRADIYAWGVVAYECLASRHPFSDAINAQQLLSWQISKRPPSLLEHDDSVPASIANLTMRCLEKAPSDRPADALQLLDILDRTATAAEAGPASLPVGRSRPSRLFADRRRLLFASAAAVVAIVLLTLTARQMRARGIRATAPQRIEAALDRGDFGEAFNLAVQAHAVLGADSTVTQLLGSATTRLSLRSDPSGARVYRQTYNAPNTAWALVGRTPVDSVAVPRGHLRLRVEHEGYRPYFLALGFGRLPDEPVRLRSVTDSSDNEMVPVAGDPIRPFNFITGLGHLPSLRVPDFHIGRFEVTNREFARFVKQGGYQRRELWDADIRRRGRSIPWSDAMGEFIDRTGRPGPATWELGTYPNGEADFPVAGISWYEANAYARFVGKRLPTVYHWMLAASSNHAGQIAPLGNLEAKGPANVGHSLAMSGAGAFDVAGNVREWLENAAGANRFILGGGWNDPTYMFYYANNLEPLDRSATNGLRLASYTADAQTAQMARPIEQRIRNLTAVKPASPEVFETYRRMYAYDDIALAAVVERVDTSAHWIRQRVSFASSSPGERIIAYLWLPRRGQPPYQTLVLFPGASAVGAKAMPPGGYGNLGDLAEFSVKRGRAMLQPIYKGTYERSDAFPSAYPNETNFYRDRIIQIAKDLRRSVDYLESRTDTIDAERLGYLGISWGGAMAGVMLGVEPRFKAATLWCPGLWLETSQPEVDPVHFLPHVRIPVLMVGGRHDAIYPYANSQIPMYQLLGSAPDEKRHVVTESDHCPARNVFYKEALSWLDRYLGPTQ